MHDTAPHQLLFSSLERRLGAQTIDTWFRSLHFATSSLDKVLHIAAPNAVVKDWVTSHYSDAISRSLEELQLGQYRVQWSLPDGRKSQVPVSEALRPLPPPGLEEALQVSRKEVDEVPFVEGLPSTLNEKYQFSNFVVASCNRFAHAAAKAVAEAPGK